MTTEKKKRVIIDIVYVAVLGLSIFFVLHYAIPLILPFLIGFAIAYILKPLIRKLHHVSKVPMKFVSLLYHYSVLYNLCYIIVVVWSRNI